MTGPQYRRPDPRAYLRRVASAAEQPEDPGDEVSVIRYRRISEDGRRLLEDVVEQMSLDLAAELDQT